MEKFIIVLSRVKLITVTKFEVFWPEYEKNHEKPTQAKSKQTYLQSFFILLVSSSTE